MNKKGLAPLILIPLIIVGVVVLILGLQWVVGALVELALWAVGLGFLALSIFIVYIVFMWLRNKSKGGRKR